MSERLASPDPSEGPPRPRGRIWLIAIVAFGVGAVVARACGPSAPIDAPSPDEPEASEPDPEAERAWTCAMHPEYRSDAPGRCPLCSMELIPVEVEPRREARQVRLGARARRLAKIETTVVSAWLPADHELRLIGRMDYDETTRRDITATAAGRVERLYVRETGATVRKGQRIANIYSPEFYAAAREYASSRDQLQRLSDASAVARAGATALVDAALERLHLLAVPTAEIERLRAGGVPRSRVDVRAEAAGTVIERRVTEGVHVKRGSLMYRLADLSSLWLQLDAYERDLAVLRVGQAVAFRVDALADRVFSGQVAFIHPRVDPTTRVAQVRVTVDNEDGALRPGMVAHAVVRDHGTPDPTATRVAIPATSVLYTGQRAVVYLEIESDEETTYEARTVQLGRPVGGQVPVLEGLAAGERVVTNGAFVIDADLQIRGGDSMMRRAEEPDPGSPAHEAGDASAVR
ncbi:MAG: efflux RND transporter periplasmic adaptor subunit [Myxococcales bacterium FL481]|nr:MAG: efflux RND transporter periplasmic adaptor subunit [Myxococcales bacterium FL481]